MNQQFTTHAIHAGEERRKPFGSLTTPVVQTSTYTFSNTAEIIDFMESKQANERPVRDEYGRYSNPTIRAAEGKLAMLEGGASALLFSSGMSAISTTLLALLSSGDHIIMASDCYHRTLEFAMMYLERWGIRSTLVPIGQPEALKAAITPQTRLVFSESPTNPYLRVMDIEHMVATAKKHRLFSIVDSTFATPVNMRPLEYGVDLVIHSASKYLGGHNDLLAGVVIGDRHLTALIESARGVMGSVSNPNDGYLLLRGVKTLDLRVRQQNYCGELVAKYLESHPAIRRVYYPGLPSHPDYEVARRQMSGFGGVVSFEIEGDFEATGKFVDRLQLPFIGPTLGGVESIVQQPAALYSLDRLERKSAGIKDNLIRYALGIEAPEDIIADLDQALAGVSL